MLKKWIEIQEMCASKTGITKISQRDLADKIGLFITEIHYEIKKKNICDFSLPLPKSDQNDYDNVKIRLIRFYNKKLIKYVRLPTNGNYWRDVFKGGINMDKHLLNFEALTEIIECNFQHEVFLNEMTTGNNDPFSIIDNNKALEKHSWEDLVKLRAQICYDTMPGLTDDHMGGIPQWVDIHKSFPDNCKMLMRCEEIVGYWFFICLNDEFFEMAKYGKLHEGCITLDCLKFMYLPGDYKGYFAAMAIKQNGINNFLMLFNSFFKQLEKFAEEDIFISEWCVNGYTPQGQSICKTLKMTHLCTNEVKGEMYYVESWWNLNLPILTKYPKLIELYKKHFDK